jgi:hypothetical protein
MWALGRSPGSPSRVPLRTETSCGRLSAWLKMGEPQRGQKWRLLPGDDSKAAVSPLPGARAKWSLETSRLVAKEEPEAWRHCPQ